MQWSNLGARFSLVAMVHAVAICPRGRAATLPTTGGDSLRVVIFEVGVESAYPRWSRDGQFRLFAVNSDGSGLTQLTQPPDSWYDARAQVSPDGREIVFNRQKSGSIGILIGRLPQG